MGMPTTWIELQIFTTIQANPLELVMPHFLTNPISPTRLMIHSRTLGILNSGVFNPSSHVPSFNGRHRARMDVKEVAEYFTKIDHVCFVWMLPGSDYMDTKCTKCHMQNWLRYPHKAKQRQSQSRA